MRSWPRTFFKRLNPVLFIEHRLSSEYDVLESRGIENNTSIAAVLEKTMEYKNHQNTDEQSTLCKNIIRKD